MKNAIIIHGYPDQEEYEASLKGASGSHWIPWLKNELQQKGIPTETPEMPCPWKPEYSLWKKHFETLTVSEETLLIGHSCGAGFLVRYLSENDIRVGKVFLIAPWMDPDGAEKENITDFFDFKLDPYISQRADGITIFVSSDDTEDVLETSRILESTLEECTVLRMEGMEHFTMDTFPQLLTLISNT